MVSQDISILKFILSKRLLDLEPFNHTRLDFLVVSVILLRLISNLTHLVDLNRSSRRPIHLLLDIRNQRVDPLFSVHKDLALTGKSLMDEIKVFQEDHDRWLGGIGMESLESSLIGVEIDI